MEIWAVTAAGQLAPTPIISCEPLSAPVELVLVLTRIGDVLAASSSQLAGAQGPISAEGIRPGQRALELVAPGDIPRATGRPTPLEGLEGFVAVVPEDVSSANALREALQRAHVAHDITVRGGWVAARLGGCEQSPEGWHWEDELELLLALTAWTPEDGVPVHRTRIADRAVRSRLVGALLACGRNFELRWVPAYLPLEARIAPTDAAPAAFTGIVAVQHTTGKAVDVTVRDATAAVVDLAYLRLRQVQS